MSTLGFFTNKKLKTLNIFKLLRIISSSVSTIFHVWAKTKALTFRINLIIIYTKFSVNIVLCFIYINLVVLINIINNKRLTMQLVIVKSLYLDLYCAYATTKYGKTKCCRMAVFRCQLWHKFVNLYHFMWLAIIWRHHVLSE